MRVNVKNNETEEDIDITIAFIHMYLHPSSNEPYEQRKLKHREITIKALEHFKKQIVLENKMSFDSLCNSLNAWSHSESIPKEARDVMLKAQGVINVLRG